MTKTGMAGDGVVLPPGFYSWVQCSGSNALAVGPGKVGSVGISGGISGGISTGCLSGLGTGSGEGGGTPGGSPGGVSGGAGGRAGSGLGLSGIGTGLFGSGSGSVIGDSPKLASHLLGANVFPLNSSGANELAVDPGLDVGRSQRHVSPSVSSEEDHPG